MAFSEALRRIGTIVGLYGKDQGPDPYGQQQGYPGDGYGYGNGGDYPPPEEYARDAYPPMQQDEETDFQSGYGATGGYARAGAKPRQNPPQQQPRQPAEYGGGGQQQQQGGFFGRGNARGGQNRQQAAQGRPDNVIPMPPRDYMEHREPEAYEAYETDAPLAARGGLVNARTIVFCARRKEDSEQIITYLVDGVTIVLNLEELDDVQFRRVLDMVSGAAFALGASIVRTSHRGYLVAPEGMVILEGEAQQPRGERDYRDRDRDRDRDHDARDMGYASSRW